ncbi:MAG: cytochrome c maturation protein CcmE [Gammaproteobacteria bacterium]|jgi:cytochrome c-type biogenesis protein CcmE|tara:strand:+ start:870 stop:1325 length:456 start_codon:yes stop_codon:yes gene_type:complete
MKKRSARIYYVSFLLVILGFVLYLFINTFNDNLLYYRSPTQLVNGNFPDNYIFRIGGMVEEGSLIRESGTKKVSFNVTDFDNKVTVKYDGILPDLFREGQGVVIRGHLEKDYFVAEEVLAKHDETYMPPEVQESLGLSEESKSKTIKSIKE